MDKVSDFPVLAADGGGTRSRLAFQDRNGRVSVEVGAANVSTDFDDAVSEVCRGLALLSERLGCSVGDLIEVPAFVGLAGVVSTELSNRLRAALPLVNVRVADDCPAAVRGALGRRNGVISHCGTGSFFAAQQDGEIRVSGGWGSVLGDEASAQWVGRLALGMTLETADGRREATPLAARLIADFRDAAGIVKFAGSARPHEFGALAPLVTEHAARGDDLATEIMQRGAGEIARALHALGWKPGLPICLTGGIGPCFASYLSAEMRECLAEAAGEPLDGAISLAEDFAREVARDRG